MPLSLNNIITQVNSLIDDQLDNGAIIAWINDALDMIGTETNTILPSADTYNVYGSLALPDRWVRMLVIPFAVGRAKQQDSSQFEYTTAYNQFLERLGVFVQQYQMPDDYKILELGQELTKPDATTYTTVSDDTLYSLARDWSTTVAQIKTDNDSIQFVTNEFEGDMYSEPSLPWMGAF